ncbi:MAG: biofilm PGA synthesis protein PgaB [Bacteroidales bacterium]|nr:biofilm PGA synthesis protein PgaB [Bacteroidales bacterium]
MRVRFVTIAAPIALSLLLGQCAEPAKQSRRQPISVGVFEGHGGAQTCIWEAVAAIALDPDMRVRTIGTGDIARGILDSLDAIIIPGGGGSRQYLNLGAENAQRIARFVANGGGAVGICAGAYLFSNTPGYSCLKLNGAQAIDIEHDNRGHGVAKFTLTPEGRTLFPELAQLDTLHTMYYEGPVFIAAPGDSLTYTEFATMQSDVHEEGNAPANMTNNRPFFIGNRYGRGRVFSSIAHPEGTPGMIWLIPRMVRWTLGLPQVGYSKEAVNPSACGPERLMSVDDLRYESKCFSTFLYGTPDEKVAALEWLHQHQSWDAKRWVQGLLFDASPQVRLRAAQYIADIHYLHYLPDLRAAHQAETDALTKGLMGQHLQRLEALLP